MKLFLIIAFLTSSAVALASHSALSLTSELKLQPTEQPQSNPPGYIYPVNGVISSGYGWHWGRMHTGIDIAGSIGTPIAAAATGIVQFAGWKNNGYGNLVEIQHPDGNVTRYAHNNRILVHKGERVHQGQLIAEMGSTGYSTGPHCHFELLLPAQGAVNPLFFLAKVDSKGTPSGQ
ncbi:M23 family metallopeptidase [Kovacikia minuta CCNUW1]|uniref:M23 family metallopeptidase n=1 Tax=Kovacikia minuta TaxID=2931930 RepID=UPI001CCB0412|nr:M23 family metallopeptidase [Kovacikia minuta CCNUW1]